MAEPTIICPKCKNEIKLTESLAAPLIESTRLDYEQRLAQKDLDVAGREKSIQEREEALSQAKDSLESQVNERVQKERAKIAVDEGKKAKLALSNEINQKTQEVAELHEILKQKDEKLTAAQKTQADLLKKQRELDDAKRELELTVEKRVSEGLTITRQQARKEAEDEMKLKVSEKEQTIASMQKKIEELKLKAEQGFTKSILPSSSIHARASYMPSLSLRTRTMKDHGRNLFLAMNCSIAGAGMTFWRASMVINSIPVSISP